MTILCRTKLCVNEHIDSGYQIRQELQNVQSIEHTQRNSKKYNFLNFVDSIWNCEIYLFIFIWEEERWMPGLRHEYSK